MTAVAYPHSFVADAMGRPLDSGYLYVGEENKDPQTFPVQCYWDASLTIPATQPIAMTAGYIVNSGTRADLYVAQSAYSIRVRDRSGTETDYSPSRSGMITSASLQASSGASLVNFIQSGTGAVARSVQSRLRDVVNVKDFGAVGDGVTNDTAAIQAAINFAQQIKAWIYFPPVTYAYMVTGLTIGQTGTNYTCHFMGGGFDPSMAAQTGITGQYVAQSMIKLIDGSNSHLITVNADAAPPMFHNMTFNGNKAGQTSGTLHCINLADAAAAAYYRFACWMENCLVTSARNSGIFIGSNRGAGFYSNVWVQYCGTTTSDSGINVRCFDQQFKSCQIGPNTGNGMYLGSVTQIQISDCVMFMNNVGMQVSVDVGHLQVSNSAFDSNATFGTDVVGGGTAEGGRIFTGCHWRRNSTSANNTYSDIRIDSDRRISLIGPCFGGKETGSNLVKYCIEFGSTTQTPLVRVSEAIREDASGSGTFATSFTSNDAYLMLAGTKDAFIGKFGSGNSMSVVCNSLEKVRFDASGSSFLTKMFPPKDDGTIQSAAGVYGGSGAPNNANGANGDFYFRSDGGAGSRIYFKTGGSWTGIV